MFDVTIHCAQLPCVVASCGMAGIDWPKPVAIGRYVYFVESHGRLGEPEAGWVSVSCEGCPYAFSVIPAVLP